MEKIAGLRDIIIHDYFGLDYDILWDVVKNKIPSLKETIATIIRSEAKNNLQGNSDLS